jgi:hypothetical protein
MKWPGRENEHSHQSGAGKATKKQVGEELLASLWLSSARDFSDLLVSPCLRGSSVNRGEMIRT